MDRLWTPWRYDYITSGEGPAQGAGQDPARKGVPTALDAWPADRDIGCVFCNMIAAVDYAIRNGMSAEEAEHAAYIVERGPTCFLCLNRYPYSTGHVMMVPYRHTDSLAELPGEAAQEMMSTVQRTERLLRQVYRPDGINLGMNLGEAAGAGVAGHIHMHVLPRWAGDTNFMTVVADTRVLPETLDTTWERLRRARA